MLRRCHKRYRRDLRRYRRDLRRCRRDLRRCRRDLRRCRRDLRRYWHFADRSSSRRKAAPRMGPASAYLVLSPGPAVLFSAVHILLCFSAMLFCCVTRAALAADILYPTRRAGGGGGGGGGCGAGAAVSGQTGMAAKYNAMNCRMTPLERGGADYSMARRPTRNETKRRLTGAHECSRVSAGICGCPNMFRHHRVGLVVRAAVLRCCRPWQHQPNPKP